MLSRDELSRYSRHIFLPEIGKTGQLKLKNARVMVVGAGGLGSPVLLYLAAAGVGHITFFEDDNVELVNLQRQIIYSTRDIGSAKARMAGQALNELNPDIEIQPVPIRLTPHNIDGLIGGCDLVLETSDNFPTKFLINDVCVLKKIPLIMGGIFRFMGHLQYVIPNETACYRCVFLDMPEADSVPNCSQAGVFGAIAGIVGSWQAAMAIKYICGISDNFSGIKEISMEHDEMMRKIVVPRNKNCKICSDSAIIKKIEPKNYLFQE